MKSRLTSKIGILFLKGIALLPFGVIYLISDFFFLVIFYIVGYRKEVVFKNLKNSFPHKDEKELKSIQKKFFRHFSDLSLETIKMAGMSDNDFRARFKVNNIDLLNSYYEKGRSIVVLTMHYNNWEWTASINLHIKHTILGVYKPLHNLDFDEYINKMRAKMGAELIPNSKIFRRVIKAEKDKEPAFIWLAGDQTPPVFNNFWFHFLNQDAHFYEGPAFLSRRFNQPVFFQKIKKTGRGRYETSFELLFENPSECSDEEIISTFIKNMEETIHKNPEYYLWSHKRWKHKRPNSIPIN